jgi:hypothetical protein
MDLTKVSQADLCEVFPKCLTEIFNLAKNAQMTQTPQGAVFKATGIIFSSFYGEDKPKSASLLGCPLVCAVASALAKSSGKTVVIAEQTVFPKNTVSVQLSFE